MTPRNWRTRHVVACISSLWHGDALGPMLLAFHFANSKQRLTLLPDLRVFPLQCGEAAGRGTAAVLVLRTPPAARGGSRAGLSAGAAGGLPVLLGHQQQYAFLSLGCQLQAAHVWSQL